MSRRRRNVLKAVAGLWVAIFVLGFAAQATELFGAGSGIAGWLLQGTAAVGFVLLGAAGIWLVVSGLDGHAHDDRNAARESPPGGER